MTASVRAAAHSPRIRAAESIMNFLPIRIEKEGGMAGIVSVPRSAKIAEYTAFLIYIVVCAVRN
ncbi:hypothetical protein [Bordetella holmesii]|nr:hypothetical protein [Bordetella holmesii]MBO1239225.1 hypothetical protein [Bordetella holmesii]MBO1243275.1 hypothetical protein [Bordetella holmesii]MBO1246417.1 hypothetical protein [Bordetella holmesii]MBO1251339.1 hypothetical protein [Bordetella holmesii]MBO1257572.1 hypothetical protein [Bordetella holmesii]